MGKKDRRNKKKEDVSTNTKDKTSKPEKPPTSALNKGPNVKLATKVSADCETTLPSSVENGRHSENSTKDNEVPAVSHSEVQQNEPSSQDTVKFSKRKIRSNWERYDETETLEPYSDFLRGTDFDDALMSSQGSAGSHFQFQDEKSWNEGMDKGNVGELFTLDCEDLSAALSCIPLNTLLSLDKEVFPNKVLRKLEDTAKRHASSYSPSRRSMEFLSSSFEANDGRSALLDKLFELVDIDPEKRKQRQLKTSSLPNQTVYHKLEFNLANFKTPKTDSDKRNNISNTADSDTEDENEVSSVSVNVGEDKLDSPASFVNKQTLLDTKDCQELIEGKSGKQELDKTIKNGQITNITVVNNSSLEKEALDKSVPAKPSSLSSIKGSVTSVLNTDKCNVLEKEEDDLNALLALSQPVNEEKLEVDSSNLIEKEETDTQKETETNIKLFNNESTIESLEDWLDSVI